MKQENKNAQAFLAHHGIRCRAKYFPAGSVRGWRFYDGETRWTTALRERLTALGFTNYNGEPLNQYSGNGGRFEVFCRGNESLRTQPAALAGNPWPTVNEVVVNNEPPPAKDYDLALASDAIAFVRKSWAERAADYLRTKGDQGSCVLGAGISVPYLAPGCRTPRERMLIDAPGGQGSLVWEDSVQEFVAYLRGHGLPGAFYQCGRMD